MLLIFLMKQNKMFFILHLVYFYDIPGILSSMLCRYWGLKSAVLEIRVGKLTLFQEKGWGNVSKTIQSRIYSEIVIRCRTFPI